MKQVMLTGGEAVYNWKERAQNWAEGKVLDSLVLFRFLLDVANLLRY
jgi:hypothetical protein